MQEKGNLKLWKANMDVFIYTFIYNDFYYYYCCCCYNARPLYRHPFILFCMGFFLRKPPARSVATTKSGG